MSERVYEAEIRFEGETPFDGQGWRFVGNFTVVDWTLSETLERTARERQWPAGEYRLSYVESDGVSGSFFLYSLKVRSDPVYEAHPTAILEALA